MIIFLCELSKRIPTNRPFLHRVGSEVGKRMIARNDKGGGGKSEDFPLKSYLAFVSTTKSSNPNKRSVGASILSAVLINKLSSWLSSNR